jgi:hypothetical protein
MYLYFGQTIYGISNNSVIYITGSPSSAAQPSTGPPSAAFFVALLLTWQKWWSGKL